MKTRYKILLVILVICPIWIVLTAPIYPQERPCDVGFEDSIIGYCIPHLSFFTFTIPSIYAIHDPNQPLPHSIILPPDIKEKTFDEFMEWCEPYYKERCVDMYEKNKTMGNGTKWGNSIPIPENDIPPFVKGLSKLQKAVSEDIPIGNYSFNDVVHGGGIGHGNLHITINPEITDPVEQEEIFQELVIILGFDSFEINFAKPVQQDKALCESENVILKDGICMKVEDTCRVYHILGYAIDDCDNHIPIFLILSALVLICATGAFIYTWRKKW